VVELALDGPEGQYSGGIHELAAIGRIVLDGVRELRERVVAETWSAHIPGRARGTRRVRDPRHRGRP
jgi:hypothetical protein